MQNILVVENDLSDQKYFHAVLYHFFDVEIVNNEDEAIQIIELKRFDLILLGYAISPVSEADIIAIFRKSLHTISRNIPILIVTANSSICNREYCLMSDADDYLRKPILPLDLIDAVRFHLKQSIKQMK